MLLKLLHAPDWKKKKTKTKTCTSMFIKALFTTAKYGSNLSVYQQIKKMWYIHTQWNITEPWKIMQFYHLQHHRWTWGGCSGNSAGKKSTSTCNMGDLSLIPGLRRFPGGGHGNPLQYSCLENSHGQRSPAGYSPWGLQRVRHNWVTKHSTA